MFEILTKKILNDSVKRMDIYAPLIAKAARPGQFVILRVDENGERIPLTIADFDQKKGTVTVVFQEIGMTTKSLGKLNVGSSILDLVGPLGKPAELDGLKKVLAVGGGVGIAPLYPEIKYLHSIGSSVDTVLGGKSADYVILKEDIRRISQNVYIATDDGSEGVKGFVTDVVKKILDDKCSYDEVIAIGPLIMMKAVTNITKKYDIPTMVSLNPIMIDGTGMCGGCRVTVGGKTRFACVDGPEFNGFEVDFDEAMRRQSMYKDLEKRSLDLYEHECKIGIGRKE